MAQQTTLQIDRNSAKPIFRQIEDYILAGIHSGRMRPGDRIPSQYELARECQVSRATVQRAIDRLVLDEILYYQPGKGIYVAEPAERQRLPILQSVSRSLRALGHQVHADLLLTEHLEASPTMATALALAPGEAVIHLKRLQYVNDEPMMLQEVYLEAERFQAVLNRDLRQESLADVLQEVGVLWLAGSTVAVGAGVANWEESRTLNVPAGASLLTIEEIDYDGEEQPIRFSRNKLRGDRFRAVASTIPDREITLEYRLQPGTVSITLL